MNPLPDEGGAWSWVLGLDTAYLAVLLGFAAYHFWPSLFHPWYLSSDEYVIVVEVVRFVQLDFRQHSFAMPGTPLMFLAAAIWGAGFAILKAAGAAGSGAGLVLFTYQHIEALFTLMRGLTVLFFCLSVVLLFVLTARLTNRFGAWVASLILVTSPIYTEYSSFIRVESLSLSLMLASLLCLVRWREQPEGRLVWRSGILAGLAAACRFHSMTASLPVLLLFIAGRRMEPAPDYPRWARNVFGIAAVVVALANLLLFGPLRPDLRAYPHAAGLLRAASVSAAFGLALAWGAYRFPVTRRPLLRLVPVEAIGLVCGFAAGLLAGTPTLLWQWHPHLLVNMEMYKGSYVDVRRLSWSLWENISWYVTFYLGEAAPGSIVPVLLGAGVVLALVLRRLDIVWIAAGIVLFFFSKPIALVAAAHHIILWLPYVAIVAAFPVAVLWEFIRRQEPPRRAIASALLAVGFGYLFLSLAEAPAAIARAQGERTERLTNVEQATAWIQSNTASDASILVAYYCFNAEIAFAWFQATGVSVPAIVKDSRKWVIWWGHTRAFKGQSGYAVLTKRDVGPMKRLGQVEPGEGADPYTDPRFQRIRSFGTGTNEVDVFRFDDRPGATTAPGTADALLPPPRS